MFHNLFIQVAANGFLTIFWHGERAHNAYWVLLCEGLPGQAPVMVADGPFPNQFMAAADFYKRGPELSKWVPLTTSVPQEGVEPAWKEAFGVNFREAFKASQPDGESIDGTTYVSFKK